MAAHKDMTVEAKFKVGDYVQRVNQPEVAGTHISSSLCLSFSIIPASRC